MTDQPLRREAGSEATLQMDLLSWLTAQLDHDEQVALGAARNSIGPTWTAVGLQSSYDVRVDDHIALHDPARVLRQVAAHRRTLGRHQSRSKEWGIVDCSTCLEDTDSTYQDDPIATWASWPCAEIRNVASIYSDRPGYDPSWAVS